MDQYIALSLCLVSVLCYGTMYVPFRGVKLGDGVFIQWLQCLTLFSISSLLFVLRSFPVIYAHSLLAGAIWASGNLLTIPMIDHLGTALGAMTRGTVQILVGWTTGRFGLLGLRSEVPTHDSLAYIGVLLTIISGAFFVLVRNTPPIDAAREGGYVVAQSTSSITNMGDDRLSMDWNEEELMEDARRRGRRRMIVGFLLATVSGILFGEQLTPLQHLHERHPSVESFDQAFGFACGALLVSSAVFLVYVLIHKSEAFSVIRPSLMYGVMFTMAIVAWFVSNDRLSQSITYPINSRLPNIIVAAWGVFYFGEIRGSRNLWLLAVGSSLALIGVVFVALAA